MDQKRKEHIYRTWLSGYHDEGTAKTYNMTKKEVRAVVSDVRKSIRDGKTNHF